MDNTDRALGIDQPINFTPEFFENRRGGFNPVLDLKRMIRLNKR
jgi:hypothetical protein